MHFMHPKQSYIVFYKFISVDIHFFSLLLTFLHIWKNFQGHLLGLCVPCPENTGCVERIATLLISLMVNPLRIVQKQFNHRHFIVVTCG